ncbi:MAG TPA: zinc-dependent peptidase [Flavobacterium sp.]|jgi:hypothetical protein
MDTDLILSIFLWIAVSFFGILMLLNSLIEPLYSKIFRRPLYLYWYPILKKLTPEQRKVLNDVPYYRRLSDRHKTFFEHRTVDFMESYTFYGKNALVITDAIKVTVASAYIMLTFGMRRYKTDVFDKIILYPDSYLSTISDELHNGEFNPNLKAIVFSWKHFQEGYREGSDNLNLGIHEFAHALHYHGLQRGDRSAIIFSEQYARIMKEVKHPPNAKRLVDSEYFRIYAYTNEFEFLAVILEHFFETPQIFKKEFPELYDNVRLMINYRS